MPLTYVHLSDIHFGQEKGADLIVHNDVKARLIDDAADLIRTHFGGVATGVIVTGDVAYGGKAHEYDSAAKWLDQLTEAVHCPKTAVKLVPGNHDIDRDKISASCKYLLDEVVLGGEPKLDAFLRNEDDRRILYRRFAGYEPFALGYDCPLDSSGGIASDSREELAPGRSIRFFGLNSALICSLSDKEGHLLLGAAQRVLPTEPGVELVVLCHHPLNWLQDSADARRYVRNRARVFISGHEHNPSLQIENVHDGCDLLTLAAGATVPPRAENGYTYTYNLLTFDWCSEGDRLLVKVMPRAWSEDAKHFRTDDVRLGSHEPTNRLASPNFRRGAPCVIAAAVPPISENQDAAPPSLGTVDGTRPQAPKMEAQVTDAFQLVILKFFRVLTPAQRLTVLVDLNALPADLNESLSLSMERHVVDSLVRAGRLEELDRSIQQIQSQIFNSKGGKE